MKPIDAELMIKNLSAMKTQLGCDAIDIDGMIKALREAEEVKSELMPSNDLLTLDELRKMDGEPVWFETVDNDLIYECGWAIVSTEYERIAGNSTYFYFEDFGRVWISYRHKPSA